MQEAIPLVETLCRLLPAPTFLQHAVTWVFLCFCWTTMGFCGEIHQTVGCAACHFERLPFPAGDCQHVQREALGVSNWQKCSVVGFVFGQDQPMTGRRSTSLSMLLWASLHTCEGHHPLEDTTSPVEEWCWGRDGPWCKKRSVEKKKEGENTAYTPLCPHPWGQQTMVFTMKEKQPQLWATFLTFYPVSW